MCSLLEEDRQVASWFKNMSRIAAQFNTSDFNSTMQRQFRIIRIIGMHFEEETKVGQLTENMTKISYSYTLCPKGKNCTRLPSNIENIFAYSRNETLLRQLWIDWRDATGKKMRQLYSDFVPLCNEAWKSFGYEDIWDYWRSAYETENLEQIVANLVEELKPLYQQVHTYVRRRLRDYYNQTLFPTSGHIPAHLLGDLWAQYWNNLQDILLPFPNKTQLNVTDEMVNQNYTKRQIFKTAENFFTSLGMEKMPESFWTKSMLEKPTDGRDVQCDHSVWDFLNGTDFRINQCTKVNMAHLKTAHYLVGEIMYFMQYRHQPPLFREWPNNGFRVALENTISMLVLTPKHLHQIGLLPSPKQDNETDLNFLMDMALETVVFLPFAYVLAKWRWDVFSGQTTPDNYTQAWWNLRCNIQGISPPVNRTEEDFDPGAIFQIAANVEYIRFFVAYILKFQFHKALCDAAGHQGPLHTCDIYNSTAAGDKLKAMMAYGRSKVWTVPLEALTGQANMSAQPLLEYFQPLMTYLKEENKHDNVGWDVEECPLPQHYYT